MENLIGYQDKVESQITMSQRILDEITRDYPDTQNLQDLKSEVRARVILHQKNIALEVERINEKIMSR